MADWRNWMRFGKRAQRKGGRSRNQPSEPGESSVPNLEDMRVVTGFVGVIALLGLSLLVGFAIVTTAWEFFASALWAVALLAAGMFVGFLFGIPKVLQKETVDPPPPSTDAATGHASTAPAPGSSTQAGYAQRVNTNLEEISDWLTKIIVGIGLVELKEIPAKLESLAGSVGRTLGVEEAHTSVGLAVVLFFLSMGFLYGYLMTRLYLQGAFSRAEGGLGQVQRDLEETTQKADAALATVAALRLPPGRQQEGTRGGERGTQRQPETDESEIEEFKKLWKSDPHKGFAQGLAEANDRRLTATITPVRGVPGMHRVHLQVVPTQPTRPLREPVIFHLHPTFDLEQVVVEPDIDGTARYDLLSWGAFTVGAETDRGRTRLELDLCEVPGGEPIFYQD